LNLHVFPFVYHPLLFLQIEIMKILYLTFVVNLKLLHFDFMFQVSSTNIVSNNFYPYSN